MALRGPAGAFNLRVGTDKDAQAIKMLQYAAPWLLWIFGVPTAAGLLLLARHFWGHATLISVGLGAGVVLLTVMVWKLTSAKGMDRVHHTANMAGIMGWLWSMVSLGPSGVLGIMYLLGGIIGCTAWCYRYSKRHDAVLDAIPAKAERKQPVIDMGYVARAVAQKAPVVRTVLEGAGNVAPALKRPWEPAGELTAGAPASFGSAADGTVNQTLGGVVLQSKVVGVDPKPIWERIARNWKVFTTQRQAGRELNGARLVLLSLSPTRIKTKVVLRRGDQLPKAVEAAREHLAVMNGLPLAQIIVLPNLGTATHGEVLVDWIIVDTLSDVMKWQGIDGQWRSIMDGPLIYGQYEDGKFAELWHPHVPGKKNLTHLAFEGMTRSGKSNVARLAIAQGVRIHDVVDWVMDPKKATQTMGCVSNAIDWLAIKEKEAVDLIDFVKDYVTARADYLGTSGYDEWDPKCGLPFHRIWLEEGNLCAELLGSDMEEVGNLAASTGVALNGSFQRMHHGRVPTGLRAVFSESMSFGCKSPGDAFVIPDELVMAGANPALWRDAKPGMHYWASKTESLERQLMPVRSFHVEDKLAGEVCDTYGEEKAERLRTEFPDWIALINKLDVNGVYKNRTTGPKVRQGILEARAKRAGRKAPTNEPVPSPRDPEPEDDITPTTENEDSPMGTDDGQPAEYNMYSDPAYLEGMKRGQPTTALVKSAEAMGMDPSMFDSVQDESLDDQEIPFPHPDRVLTFNQPPMPDKPHDKAKSLAHLIAYLASEDMGPGKKFRPHEVAAACMPITGKVASWYRGMLTGELVAMGVVDWDKTKGEHRVSRDIRNEDTRRRVEEQLSRIPADA
jgi:hypothetical protein